MCSLTGPCEIGWAEELPANCPPAGASTLDGTRYYRFVDTFPPTSGDFISQRQLFPQRKFDLCECRVRSVSLINSADKVSKLQKLPNFREKILVHIAIPLNAGAKKQTNPWHISWWRCASFDPVGASIAVSLGSMP